MHSLERTLIRKADCYIDDHHPEFARLGKQLFKAFGSDGGRISSQVRNLEQVAFSAIRLADVEDFVKNQMGRQVGGWLRVGDVLLSCLRQLRQASETMAEDSGSRLLLRLRLGRGWVRAVVGEYLYRVALAEMRDKK